MFCEECGTVLDAHGQCLKCDKEQSTENVEQQENLNVKLVSWGEILVVDPRFCPVCRKLLLKQDRNRLVLVTRCDQCFKLIHERCYLKHHLLHHELIGVITDVEEPKISSFINENRV